MSDIGFRIKLLRNNQKITQKDFAKKICVTQSYLSRVELGIENPTDMLLKLISLEFNCSLTWLQNGIGEMMSSDYDYWIRNESDVLKKGAIDDCYELINLLKNDENTTIGVHVSAIINSVMTLLKIDSQRKKSLLFDNLAALTSEFTEIINELEKKGSDKKEITKYIVNCANDVSNEIKAIYSQNV